MGGRRRKHQPKRPKGPDAKASINGEQNKKDDDSGDKQKMGKAQRMKIIEQLQNERGTFVISYITSTRQNLEVEMAMDAIRKIYEHLRLIGKPREEARIDLFIHSNGGDGTVPWRLVTLIREYTNEFCVLVPHRAFSAATLTALGANRIIMHPIGYARPNRSDGC